MTLDEILKTPLSEISPPPPRAPLPPWRHPTSEAERRAELENFLAVDFDTFREVRIECRFLPDVPLNLRIDLLAVPKISELDVVLAFEVKRDDFDVERALKQSADYVGGWVREGPHSGKRIAACFLYPTQFGEGDRYHEGMFQLIAQWRVGRGYVHRGGLWLAIGQEVIWDSRGWHEAVARRMLLCKRTVGGSRRFVDRGAA
jgi:hypothetical protein